MSTLTGDEHEWRSATAALLHELLAVAIGPHHPQGLSVRGRCLPTTATMKLGIKGVRVRSARLSGGKCTANSSQDPAGGEAGRGTELSDTGAVGVSLAVS